MKFFYLIILNLIFLSSSFFAEEGYTFQKLYEVEVELESTDKNSINWLENSRGDKELYLVEESQTPRGLNEQRVKELRKAGFYKSSEKTLKSILKIQNKV